MATGALLFWPNPVPPFSPEKTLAFGSALCLWFFAEIFPEAREASTATTSQKAVAAHDEQLASAIYGIANDDHVLFLEEQDFGGSWLKIYADPLYKLVHFLRNPTSEFDDSELQTELSKVKIAASAFSNHLASGAWPLGNGDAFSMIPTTEPDGLWSERTQKRVDEANDLAEQTAAHLRELYRLLRRKGVALLNNQPVYADAA